jgi:hypothetical protein
MPLPPGWADSALYYVTTTGRRTGRPHEVEIWCVAVGDALYLMAGSGERSDTVRNALVADPAEDAAVRAAMVAKYSSASDDLASWGATALPLRLTLH